MGWQETVKHEKDIPLVKIKGVPVKRQKKIKTKIQNKPFKVGKVFKHQQR